MNVYLKLFLAVGIPLSILLGALGSFLFGFPVGLFVGLIAGLFAGGLFSLPVGYLHRLAVRRMPYGEPEGAMEVRHVRHAELRLPYDQAFDLCISSLNAVKKGRIRREDRPSGRIEAKAGMTWKSWGEVISFDLRRIDANRTRVEVSSKPALRTTLVDLGKNLENVERIMGFLTRRAEGDGPKDSSAHSPSRNLF